MLVEIYYQQLQQLIEQLYFDLIQVDYCQPFIIHILHLATGSHKTMQAKPTLPEAQ
jgi:hypothetical protein